MEKTEIPEYMFADKIVYSKTGMANLFPELYTLETSEEIYINTIAQLSQKLIPSLTGVMGVSNKIGSN
jgi:hypothetical protein